MIGAAAVAQIGAPAESVGLATPQREAVQHARGSIHPVIEHGIFQVLEGETLVAPIAPTERESGGESATRAAAGQTHASRVNPHVDRLIDDETQPFVAISGGERVWRFGREPVFNTGADAGQ